MKRKFNRYPIIAVLSGAMLLSLSYNVVAYRSSEQFQKEEETIITSKSDRTLIKEIHANQKEIINLLNEIKSMVK